MGNGGSSIGLGVLVLCTACGSGGGGTGGSGNDGGSALSGRLTVVTADPADGSVQVPLDAAIRVELDAPIAFESLQDEDTFLTDGSSSVPGAFHLADAGHTVVFVPASALREETDYRFELSPLTCDTTGRILEDIARISFRTLDTRPPRILSTSVRNGETGVNRTANLTLTFDEAIAPTSATRTSVQLLDAFGSVYDTVLTVAGATVTVDPCVDLAGNRKFILVVQGTRTGITDRAGNPLAASWTANFWTAPDTTPPRALSLWPPALAGISPKIQPVLSFDESIDPHSIEPASLLFTDGFFNVVAFRVEPSCDLETLRLVPNTPLVPGRTYAIGLAGGLGGVTDLSGNSLAAQFLGGFTVGTDAAPPVLVEAFPARDATRVSLNARPTVRFDEPLDPTSIGPATVSLTGPAGPVQAAISVNGATITLVPAAPLASGAFDVVVRGGTTGARDLAGNPLAADLRVSWRTADDRSLPVVQIAPEDGSSSVPGGVRVACLFDSPLDPSTVGTASISIIDDSGAPVPGTLALERAGRVVGFVPTNGWTAGSWYTVRVRGGPLGVREESGNWLDADVTSRFRVGFSSDAIVPTVEVTLNAAAPERNRDMTVPPSGFTIDVDTYDPVHFSLDLASIEIAIAGSGGPVPGSDTIFRDALVRWNGLSYLLPAEQALAPGSYTVTASVRDLSGNRAISKVLPFRVAAATAEVLPFERTQVVWVRFDLDRNGNGRSDFEDDLVDLGLIAAGDPAGTNATMVRVLREGIFAQVNRLCGRAPNGAPLGPESVPLRLTHRRPPGVPHMQIACGGLDPEGSSNRSYGAESTGTLGRAYFDYRNSAVNELNIASVPGLGVFPGEMFLFQARIHIQVYPSFVTTFARRFLKLSPHMGGIPAGSDPLDAVVLAPGFDVGSATSAQRARYDTVFGAADDWATAVGIILAHEIGHSVGLVADGRLPRGLHGDRSLHNEYSTVLDVMASAVGYDAMVSLEYRYRDLNLAYLRQRLLLK
jgi:hypothetical protein